MGALILLYAAIMACWAAVVALKRKARYRVRIVCIAFLLPVVALAMLVVMALSVLAADTVDRLTAAMPTVLGAVYRNLTPVSPD